MKTYKPLKLGQLNMAILFSLEEKPKTTVELCKEFWGDIYKISKPDVKKSFRTKIDQSLNVLKNYGLIKKAKRGYSLHLVNNFNKFLRIYNEL